MLCFLYVLGSIKYLVFLEIWIKELEIAHNLPWLFALYFGTDFTYCVCLALVSTDFIRIPLVDTDKVT